VEDRENIQDLRKSQVFLPKKKRKRGRPPKNKPVETVVPPTDLGTVVPTVVPIPDSGKKKDPPTEQVLPQQIPNPQKRKADSLMEGDPHVGVKKRGPGITGRPRKYPKLNGDGTVVIPAAPPQSQPPPQIQIVQPPPQPPPQLPPQPLQQQSPVAGSKKPKRNLYRKRYYNGDVEEMVGEGIEELKHIMQTKFEEWNQVYQKSFGELLKEIIDLKKIIAKNQSAEKGDVAEKSKDYGTDEEDDKEDTVTHDTQNPPKLTEQQTINQTQPNSKVIPQVPQTDSTNQ